MSCRNVNCTNYTPNCTNYSYVCPACTDCCTEYTNAKCVKYKGTALSCIPVATNDTLDTILTAINSKLCSTVGATYDIQCLGGSSTAALDDVIQALIDDACNVSTTTFDTTCLGGGADKNVYQAMSNVITKICNSDYTYPVIDTSCMTNGEQYDDLTHAVELLVDFACTGPTFTLDWDALVPPSDVTDTALSDILDSIVDNLRCEKITFDSDQFNVTTNVNCTKEVELDIPEVSQQILDHIEVTPTQVTQLRDMGLAKMFANETCEKKSIEEKLSFSSKFEVTRLNLNPYDYTLTLGNGGSQNTFVGLRFPNGIYHTQTYLLTNVSGLQTWLNSLKLGVFTVSSIVGGITIQVVLDGDDANYYPVAVWKNTGSSTTLLNSTFTATQDSASVCDLLRVEIDDPDAWQDVSYQNLWTGNLKYRYNKLNKTVEIRPGYINKSKNPGYVASLSEIAFTIPYDSDGKAVWNPYGKLISTCADPTDCIYDINCRIRVDDSTNDFYVDINDCTRTGDGCNPGDVITIELAPSFYYVA